MKKPKSTLLLSISITCFGLCSLVKANDTSELAKVTGELGISIVQDVSSMEKILLPSSKLAPESQSKKIENLLNSYTNHRNAYTSAKSGVNALRATTDAMIAGSAIVGNVYGIVIGTVLKGTVESGSQSLNDYANKKSQQYLIGVADQLISESGVDDFEALVANPKLIEETLIKSSSLLNDIRERSQQTNDPNLLTTVAASIAQVADSKAVAAYRLVENNSNDIEIIDKQFSSFVLTVEEQFTETSKRISDNKRRIIGLEKNVKELNNSVIAMREHVGHLGKNQDLIADFVFSKMTASERVHALEAGLLDKRIKCPEESADCDMLTIRTALVKRYKKEAEIQASIKNLGTIVSNANASLKIADDLGIELPKGVSTTVKVATAGFNAFINFKTMNYLGAISSITGLLGKNRDVAAERHKQLMRFLKSNFEHINRELKELRHGQERILNGLVGVSEQIQALHLDMDVRFKSLEFRLDKLDAQLKHLIWEPWISCNAVSSFARYPDPENPNQAFINHETLFFSDFQSRVSVLNNDEGRIRDCKHHLKNVIEGAINYRGWKTLSKYIDLEYGLDNLSIEQLSRLDREIEKGTPDQRPLLAKYLDNIVKPSSHIVKDWAKREQLDGATLLFLLSATPNSFSDIQELIETSKKGWQFGCDAQSSHYKLIGAAICANNDKTTLVNSHLNSALYTKSLVEISEWAVIMSQLLDLYDGYNDQFAKNISQTQNIIAGGSGKRLLEVLSPIITLGIAYENRLRGGLIAWIISEDLSSGRAKENHYRILSSDPYLAENVAMVLLRKLRQNDNTTHGVSLENRHAQAILHSRSEIKHQFIPFNALYGDEKKFEINNYGRPAMLIKIEDRVVSLPLPGPKQLSEGRIVMPAEYQDLIIARDRVVERLIDYKLGEDKDLVKVLSGQ